MAYMLLIVEPAGQREVRPRAEGEALYARMVQFSADLKSRGLLGTAQSLKSDASGVRISRRGGAASVIDGPFAEAKELVGGFFVLTCETRAQAIEIANQCPAADWATVEVRELGPCFE